MERTVIQGTGRQSRSPLAGEASSRPAPAGHYNFHTLARRPKLEAQRKACHKNPLASESTPSIRCRASMTSVVVWRLGASYARQIKTSQCGPVEPVLWNPRRFQSCRFRGPYSTFNLLRSMEGGGYFSFMASSASTTIRETAKLRTHLRSAGMMNHGAAAVLHLLSASS